MTSRNGANPFASGDYVWWHDELWFVDEVERDLCLLSDVGDTHSHVVSAWVSWRELEIDDGEENES